MSAPVTCALLLVFAAAQLCTAQSRPIDPHRSSITVQVSRSGIFSFVGDNHTIRAPIISGALDEGRRVVALEIDARQMKVLDPKLAADKRAEVQQRMLSPEVLDTAKYPSILFRSTSASWHGKKLLVHGELVLHGQSEPVEIRAVAENGSYQGWATIRQTRFGIKPVSIAGGTVRVKDEVRIDFAIFAEGAKPETAGQ
jgi:polyisoprenoid-binding protein YceI